MTDSLERVDIHWKMSPEVSADLYMEPIKSCLNNTKGAIRQHIAKKINLKETPEINFVNLLI